MLHHHASGRRRSVLGKVSSGSGVRVRGATSTSWPGVWRMWLHLHGHHAWAGVRVGAAESGHRVVCGLYLDGLVSLQFLIKAQSHYYNFKTLELGCGSHVSKALSLQSRLSDRSLLCSLTHSSWTGVKPGLQLLTHCRQRQAH